MGIKIVNEGNMTVAKGNPAASNVGYFFAVLLFIIGGLMIISGNLGASILAIFATIIIYACSHHAKNARLKKLRESGYIPLGETTPTNIGGHKVIRNFNNTVDSGIKCSNCGNVTESLNSFCPHCGSRLSGNQSTTSTVGTFPKGHIPHASTRGTYPKGYIPPVTNPNDFTPPPINQQHFSERI